MPALFSVCVFCGSRSGVRPAYAEVARETGRMLARRGWRLVYGAGDVGLMGEVARTAQAAGGTTFGVIPIHLLFLVYGYRDLRDLVVNKDTLPPRHVGGTGSRCWTSSTMSSPKALPSHRCAGS